MANTIDFILTNAASELISKVLSGKTLNFTRMAVGDGFSYDTTVAKGYTTLVNEVLSLDITKKETLTASNIRITSVFKNTDAQKEFYYREVGLYAQDPDTGKEILYAYGNRNDAAELITPSGSSVVTKQLIFIVSVGNSANITFNVNADVYALQEDMVEIQADVNQIQTNLGKAQTSITTLQTDLGKANTNITTLQTGLNQTKTNVTSLQSSKANKNLSNTGMMTNCLLEVPHRVKYELKDGILTIKAGTILIVPYGIVDLSATYPIGSTFLHNNFKVIDSQYGNDNKFFIWVELQEDIIHTTQGASTEPGMEFICPSDNWATDWGLTSVLSGNATPEGNKFFYNTQENHISWYMDNQITHYGFSLPIMITNKKDGIPDSINEVFNGIGYIGSTIWVDKGVKGLIPNGRNHDGTLNNIEYTTNKLQLDNTSYGPGADIGISQTGLFGNIRNNSQGLYYAIDFESVPTVNSNTYSYLYLQSTNMWYGNLGTTNWIAITPFVPIIYVAIDSNLRITSMIKKQPFQAVDYNDYSKKIFDIETRLIALENL